MTAEISAVMSVIGTRTAEISTATGVIARATAAISGGTRSRSNLERSNLSNEPMAPGSSAKQVTEGL